LTDIEFDRDAVGVSAKEDWKDANEFARISSFMSSLSTHEVAESLPTGDNSGVTALITGAGNFHKVMGWVISEYSDACGVLGSGQEAAISDYDQSESQNVTGFRDVVERMEN
jgi:hypothetical protein